jgi:hypothetical protein
MVVDVGAGIGADELLELEDEELDVIACSSSKRIASRFSKFLHDEALMGHL